MKNSKWLTLTLAVIIIFCAARIMADTVQFSDGEVLQGEVTFRKPELQVHVDKTVRKIDVELVREIRLSPEKEVMEQKWRFLRAGQVEKEAYGEPYPVRYFTGNIILKNGETISGHLYTTSLTLSTKNETRKVVLYAKDKGKPGEQLTDIIYPVSVVIESETTENLKDKSSVKLFPLPDAVEAEPAMLARPSLSRLQFTKNTDNSLSLPPMLGESFFLAVQKADRILVEWPKPENAKEETAIAKLTESLIAADENVKDFFEKRKIIAVTSDKDEETIFSLMLLERVKHTTYNKEKSLPWRLGIWRWKNNDGKLMLAGRGWLFRGIRSGNDPLPSVKVVDKLYSTSTSEDKK